MADKKKPVFSPAGESGSLKFLYETPVGRFFLKLLVNRFVSRLGGAFMNSPLSRFMIRGFVEKNQIDMERYEPGPFRCYNDFFSRKLRNAPRLDEDPLSLIAPCDSKLSVYRIDPDSYFHIKGVSYAIEDLLQDRELANRYIGGLCLIFRLTVDDYHRYCYIDNGRKSSNVFIPGKLHTVQPIALRRHDIYRENCREYTVMQTEHLGTVIQAEVGALMVGRILNFHQEGSFSKGEEKGMFQFGGSTIVLLLEEGRARLDQEIFDNTQMNLETIVKIGETIGTAIG